MTLFRLLKKIAKPIYHWALNRFIRSHEHIYTDDQGHRVRYMALRRPWSRKMVVIFSGFSAGMPKYNNILLMLGQRRYNALFILDDFINIPGGGSFYLGANGEYYAPELICRVMEDYRKKWRIRTVVTAGSSKGGTAALLMGIRGNADYIIAGGFHYYIGLYMRLSHRDITLLTGDTSSEAELDRYMEQVLIDHADDEKKPRLLLHYSDQEHTYDEHIRDFRSAMDRYGYVVAEEDVADYPEHTMIEQFYPGFFRNMLDKIRRGTV